MQVRVCWSIFPFQGRPCSILVHRCTKALKSTVEHPLVEGGTRGKDRKILWRVIFSCRRKRWLLQTSRMGSGKIATLPEKVLKRAENPSGKSRQFVTFSWFCANVVHTSQKGCGDFFFTLNHYFSLTNTFFNCIIKKTKLHCILNEFA